MACIEIDNGIMCVSDSFVNLEPYGAKVWCDYHHYLGPVFFRSANAITEIRVPSRKTWNAFQKWRDEVGENRLSANA